MALSPYVHPEIFRTLIVDGRESPGTVTLSGHDSKEEWEQQRAKGTTGTTTVGHGRGVMQFTASFFLADDADRDKWDSFRSFLQSLRPANGGKAKAVGVYHPDLVAQQIVDCVVASIGGVTHDNKGGDRVAVQFVEYRPAKPKPAAKPGASAARKPGTTVLDPNAAAKRELQLLLEQARSPRT
jgi:hypothetical protein